MQVRIHVRGLDVPPALRHRIERRLRLALGRHAADVVAVRVTLGARPELHGAAVKSCRVRARLRDGTRLEVEDRAEDLRAAASQAFWRLAHRVARRHAARREGEAGAGRRRPGAA